MNKETEQILEKLVIHSVKELGEISECLVKKDRPDHWKDELCDLVAFGIKPMLELAGMEFQYAVEVGLRRKLKKLEGNKKLEEMR